MLWHCLEGGGGICVTFSQSQTKGYMRWANCSWCDTGLYIAITVSLQVWLVEDKVRANLAARKLTGWIKKDLLNRLPWITLDICLEREHFPNSENLRFQGTTEIKLNFEGGHGEALIIGEMRTCMLPISPMYRGKNWIRLLFVSYCVVCFCVIKVAGETLHYSAGQHKRCSMQAEKFSLKN